MTSLQIIGLTKHYRGKKRVRVNALTDLNLTIAKGEVFGFLGPNGAGKSTTIKAIMGLISPTAGEIFINGITIGSASRGKIGYLPENPSFYDFMTAREYLSFVGQVFKMERAVIEKEINQVLERLDLSHAADRPIRGYSKGMTQRLGLAQALLHDPDVYILDEPMSGLDPLGRALVKDIIKDLKKQGKTVFFSTHIIADVEAVCDRVAIIAAGRLQAVSTISEITKHCTEGYLVRLKNPPDALIQVFEHSPVGDALMEVKVPLGEFSNFLRKVSREGVDVELVEPQRNDLESFFLEIVAKEKQ